MHNKTADCARVQVVLSACSPFFRQILSENPHPNPLVYLRGVSYENLVATLNFMYCGEVNISQDTLRYKADTVLTVFAHANIRANAAHISVFLCLEFYLYVLLF